MRRRGVCLLVATLLAAGCSGSAGGSSGGGGGGGGGNCTTCASQGIQCGAFVNSCGKTQQCGSCGGGTSCSKTDGTPGVCVVPGTLPPAGNPGACQSLALPSAAAPVDTSHPTRVVGTGTAASCTYAELKAAVEAGGIITFNCGTEAVTIPVAATLELRTTTDTVIDGSAGGGKRIMLDGGYSVRILSWVGGDYQKNGHVLTLQHLVLANGKASGTRKFTEYPGTECPTGYKDGQGGALYMDDGILHAVDVTFVNNQAATPGPDTGGGAVYISGSKDGAYLASCSFLGNSGSNGGGIGGLQAGLHIFNSLFDGNDANGFGANDVNANKCPYGNNQIGSGGNGGAIYDDGVARDVTICGTVVKSSHAGAYGAGLFFTSNDGTGWLTIDDSTFQGNVQDNDWWEWRPGISTNANTKDPVNSTFEP